MKENAKDSKSLYQSLNRIMHRSSENPMPDSISAQQLANEFSDFFQAKIEKIKSIFRQDNTKAFDFDQDNVSVPLLSFSDLTLDEVKRQVLKCNDKYCELDPIPARLVKLCQDELNPVIARIINLSLLKSKMPSKYKLAIVKPLLTKPNLETELKNYRPVSNLAFLCKVIEKAAGGQVTSHLANNQIGKELQSAYKAKHSTETALLKIFNEILKNLDKQHSVFLCLLDLSPASDTVNFDILLKRLNHTLGIRGDALAWFHSYLSQRKMTVKIDSSYSDPSILDCSVPQGSWLGPRLYSDYVLPLDALILFLLLLFHGYTDDTQMLKATKLTTYAQTATATHLENGIERINKCMADNKLKLNSEKPNFLL